MPQKRGAIIVSIHVQRIKGGEVTYLAKVPTMPIHKKTTLATARPFSRYFIGLPPYSRSSLAALAASVPLTYADLVARMTVYARAAERVNMHANTEHTRHAILTLLDSFRSGQKRSKKKAEPKMVAT